MTILITGIQGFVGSNLVESLKDNHLLYGLDIITTPKDSVEKIFLWKELNNLPQIDVIIHLAGKAHDLKNQSLIQEYFDVNTELTKKIYDWFLKSDAKKFIFFSSVKAVADFVEGDVLTEDVEAKPVGPYGESKREAELYILSNLNNNLNFSKKTDSKQTYILRPSMIHGKGNKGNLNLLFSVVKRGITWPLGAFDNKRSFTSIQNLQFIIKSLIEKDVKGDIYNIADDEPVSTNDIIKIISKVLEKPIRIIKINKKYIYLFALIGTSLKLPFNKERLKKLTENYVVSNDKIKKALNIDTLPTSSHDGLKETIRNF
ncbi:MAG: nucleoside-diphosphate-sugar epimerase [Bacteroidales bacterium 36-12]|nr:MAG: nucleoside-diphosphate-sugar epimerase [Bacteroidales bacterium 36-12]